MAELNLNKKTRIVFPAGSGSVISKILEKYGLKETEEEIIEKIIKREYTFAAKVAGIVRKKVEAEISAESFPLELQKELNISLKDAKNIAADLQKSVLAFAEEIPETKEGPRPTTIIKPVPKEFIEKPKRIVESPKIIPEKREMPAEEKYSGKDVYRESIE